MKIGLLGFGVVGRGVYDLTTSTDEIKVAQVLCLEDITLPDARVTHNIRTILDDPEIDTVVEAMGGLHPAFDFVREAILAGKNIVTSNKAMVASFYDELLPLATKMGVRIRCTAAVGGGIGWLSELERSRRAQTITEVSGIMNGTCNYILDSMTRLGLSYEDALKQAQDLGYAEANPATDVDGIDTLHKVVLSSNVAFGVSVDRQAIPAAGIRAITAEDVRNFKDHGLVCKLIGTGRKNGNVVSAFVQPTLFPAGVPEASIPSNYNLITFIGSASDRMSFYGQGAGRYPTAYNVLQDCIDILRGNGFYCPYGEKVTIENNETSCYYVHGGSDAWLEENRKETWGGAVVTGPVEVRQMHRWLSDHPGTFIAALA